MVLKSWDNCQSNRPAVKIPAVCVLDLVSRSGCRSLQATAQQTISRSDNVVTMLCFGCDNVVITTLSLCKNVSPNNIVTTLHSQHCIHTHTCTHTHTHIYLIISDLGLEVNTFLYISHLASCSSIYYKIYLFTYMYLFFNKTFIVLKHFLSSSTCVVVCMCTQNTTQCLCAGCIFSG